jgi:hypothetical protein
VRQKHRDGLNDQDRGARKEEAPRDEENIFHFVTVSVRRQRVWAHGKSEREFTWPQRYLFRVSVGVVQNVKLSRLTNASDIPAETYRKIALGLTTPGRMEVIEEPLKEKLAEFIADFLSVNPKNKI